MASSIPAAAEYDPFWSHESQFKFFLCLNTLKLQKTVLCDSFYQITEVIQDDGPGIVRCIICCGGFSGWKRTHRMFSVAIWKSMAQGFPSFVSRLRRSVSGTFIPVIGSYLRNCIPCAVTRKVIIDFSNWKYSFVVCDWWISFSILTNPSFGYEISIELVADRRQSCGKAYEYSCIYYIINTQKKVCQCHGTKFHFNSLGSISVVLNYIECCIIIYLTL